MFTSDARRAARSSHRGAAIRVHNEQAKPFVAKQHALEQQRVASSHAESRRLERPRSATRTSTHQRTLINDFQQPDVHGVSPYITVFDRGLGAYLTQF
jgi:hypothetical protein